MNKFIIILFSFLFLTSATKGFSQSTESAEIPVMRNSDIIPLGEVEGKAYFYGTEIHKNLIKLTVYKFNSSNLELLESKEIEIKDFDPKVFNNNKGTCKIECFHKNNKFYFFYSLIFSGDYHVYLKTVDENLSNEKTTELGTIVETGYELLGNFFVSYSPNNKNALVVLKNFCERKKAVGTNTEIYEKTELINYDLINDKIVFTKNLPIEVDGYRLKSEQYKIDNDGNIACLASTAERKDQRFTIHSLAVGYLEKNTDKIAFMNIDLSGMTSLSASFKQLSNGDLLYTIASGKSIKIKYISPKEPTKNYEKQISSPSFQDFKSGFHISDISESSNGYYLTLRSNRNNYFGYSAFKGYGVAYVSKSGELIWSKSLQLITPLFYNSGTDCFTSSVVSDNKLHVFYMENKPYEMTDRIQKQINEDVTNAVYDFKKFNTIESVIDENGTITKKVLNDNETYVLNPSLDDKIPVSQSVYFATFFKKNFKIKKIALK